MHILRLFILLMRYKCCVSYFITLFSLVSIFSDKFGAAMTLVKSDIGGNISVKLFFSFHDFNNRRAQVHVACIVQNIDKSALPGLVLTLLT